MFGLRDGFDLVLFVLLAGSVACQPSKFDAQPERGVAAEDAGTRDAGAPDADSALDAPPVRDAGADATLEPSTDAAVGDATGLDAAVDPPDAGDAQLSNAALDASDGALATEAGVRDASSAPITMTVQLTDDLDDAAWVTKGAGAPLEELLHFGPADGSPTYAIEVGTDAEACRTGLRFALAIAPGTRILQASLSLLRVGSESTADPGSTMRVSLFESTNLPAFDHAHMHLSPGEHAPLGLWSGATVGGYHVGSSDARTVSPDLAALVQHAIDQAGWQAGGHVGFMLAVDEMEGGSYAQFRDSFASMAGPQLTVVYQP